MAPNLSNQGAKKSIGSPKKATGQWPEKHAKTRKPFAHKHFRDLKIQNWVQIVRNSVKTDIKAGREATTHPGRGLGRCS